jgi:hypothetical protein
MSRVAFSLLFCALALVFSACGSSDESVDTLLAKTFGSNKSVKSGRVNAQVDANVQGVNGLNGLRLRLNGPFESNGAGKLPKFDFTLGISASGQSFSAGGVSTGDKGWLRLNNQAYAVPADLFKRFQDAYASSTKQSGKNSKNTPTLAGLGVNPRSWLRNAHKVGTEDLNGTKVVHITAGLDVQHLLADVNRLLAKAGSAAQTKQVSKLTPAQQKEIQDAVRSASVDVFTGKDDDLLRRLDVRIGLQKSGQVQGGQLRFQLQLDAVNQGQTITAPKGAKPLSDLISSLQGGAGTSGGSGSATPSTPAPSTPAPSSGSSSKYLQCVQQAGSDIAKMQACASLQSG